MADIEEIFMPDSAGNTMKLKNYNGRLWPGMFQDECIKGVETFKTRDDDVIIVDYPKSGTHWVWQIVRLLMAGRTDISFDEKVSGMIEFLQPSKLEALPSPRILNTHAHFELMPRDVLSKKPCKLVYVTRDPRDAAVSYFNHHARMPFFYFYEGKWDDFFLSFLDGKIDYESWFTYTRGWEKGMEDNPDFQVHVTSYEALQSNSFEEISKLARFLGASTDKDFISDVIETASFDNMKATKIKNTPVKEGDKPRDPIMFRKGKVGDWKNWFTVAQAEQFDAIFEREMKGTKAYELYSNHRQVTEPDVHLNQ